MESGQLTAYIVGDCASRLITDRRHFEVVFYGSRGAWWAAKCVTALVNVCACYFAVLLAVLASVFLGTSPRFTATPEVQAALLGEPALLILDEPLNALDEASAEKTVQLIRSLRDSGRLILLSCHDTEELLRLADKIIEISDGKITGCSDNVKECGENG